MANLFNIDIDQIKHNGNEVLLMKLNGNIIYERITKDRGFLVEYTVSDHDAPLNEASLPTGISTDSVNITLLNGQETFDTSTPCYKIDKVIIQYTENDSFLSFDSGGEWCCFKTIKYCKTDNFTTMNRMFYGCWRLTKINTSNWNTSNVTNMSSMFDGCYSLTKLNLSSFDTSKVTTMKEMFHGCNELTTLNLSSFNTSKVTDMHGMFFSCELLTELDLSSFDTSEVTEMGSMFYGCSNLRKVDLRNWKLSSMSEKYYSTFMFHAFSGCSSLVEVRLDNCNNDTIKKIISVLPSENNGVIYCKESQAQGLTAPGNWSFNFVLDTPEEPEVPETPETPDIPEEPEEDIPLYVSGDFENNTEITEVRIMVNETHDDLSEMFFNCTSLISVNTEDWNTSNVTNMFGMFTLCTSLIELDLSNWDTSNVTDMSGMFQGCSSLERLDLSNFNGDKLTNTNWMFNNCKNLHTLRLDNCNRSTIANIVGSSSFPTDVIEGVTRTIYCSRAKAEGFTPPKNWQISYID